MKNKEFDCVEMKRRGAARIYEETKNMTREQEIEYWRQKSEEFLKWADEVRQRKTIAPSRKDAR
jgi:hypothetical protein